MKKFIFLAFALFCFRDFCHAEVISGLGPDRNDWNLIANFREGAGLTTIDSSSNAIVLTLESGTAWVTNRTGAGNAVYFDGTNDLVTAASASEGLFDFTETSTFAIVAVISIPNTSASERVIVAKLVTWPAPGWAFSTGGASGTKLGVFTRLTSSSYHYWKASGITDAMIKNDRWHTVAMVYRGIMAGTAGKEFYFDGVSYPIADGVASGAGTLTANDAQISLGNVTGGTLDYMQDKIGVLMISRDGYAPSAQGMMDLHRRLMGQTGRVN